MIREFLKKINLVHVNYLKPNNKEDIVVRIIIVTTKVQFANPTFQERISYFLKTYEKDVFIIQNEFLARDVTK